MERYQIVMAALSESVMKNRLKRPLHGGEMAMTLYPLAIKSRYFGIHASQIKSYYGLVSGSQGRSFRILHEQSREAPLAED